MRELLRKSKPQRLDDLIALNALYRPGPLKSGMVDDYVARKQGKTEVKYDLAALEPILADTYGVIAYQEQVMRIAAVLAGFTLGQSDVLRKAMGKKDPKVMAKQREAFLDGTRAKGIAEKKATKIFELMEYFAGYGFNKSHSTAYAFLAYQTAYLKANYPRHFAAALLTIEAANTDKLALYITESRERGIAVLPPDINESQLQFSVVPEGVRFGLTAIKGLGEAAILAILDVRARVGRITSLHQLAEELDLRIANRRVFEALVKSGACDGLAQTAGTGPVAPAAGRARLLRAIDAAIEHGARVQRDREQGQANLFGDGAPAAGEAPAGGLPEGPAWTEMEWLAYEKEALGLVPERPSGRSARRGAARPRRPHRRRPGAGRGRPRPTRAARPGWSSTTCRSAASSARCARSRPRRATRWRSSRSRIIRARSRSWRSPRPMAASGTSSIPGPCCWCVASSSATTSRRASRPPSSRRSRPCASGWPRR